MTLFHPGNDFERLSRRCAAILAVYETDPESGHEQEDQLKDAAIRWLARAGSRPEDRARVASIIARLNRKTRGLKWFA
jgi:hypothetical protein